MHTKQVLLSLPVSNHVAKQKPPKSIRFRPIPLRVSHNLRCLLHYLFGSDNSLFSYIYVSFKLHPLSLPRALHVFVNSQPREAAFKAGTFYKLSL